MAKKKSRRIRQRNSKSKSQSKKVEAMAMTPRTENNLTLVPDPPKHVTRVVRDHTMKYPELWLHVHVVGSAFDVADFAEMFARAKCWKAKSIETADLVVFAGGADVDPALYGESAHATSKFFPARDSADIASYLICRNKGIPMLGVCRGAQFINVMEGGKLYQDVDGHQSNHPIYDLKHRKMIDPISSVHHQMVRDNTEGGMEVIATCARSTTRALNRDEEDTEKDHVDIEAFFYRSVCALGIQGHPEYRGYPYFTNWVLELIEEYITHSPDTRYKDQKLRIKEEVLAEREAAEKAAITPKPKTKKEKK
jgi:gamma-glutamyl-gamma-aminobutyrate hydrolase PuuD